MNPESCAGLLEQYLTYLRSSYEARLVGTDCLLVTPLLMPDNTRLGVYVLTREDGRLKVTDYGETFDRLFTSGIDLSVEDPRLTRISVKSQVTIDAGAISKVVTPEFLNEGVDQVVQAILDMAYMVNHQPSDLPGRRRAENAADLPDTDAGREVEPVRSGGQLFEAEVGQWLASQTVIRERPEVRGATGSHTFDFEIPLAPRPVLLEALSRTKSPRLTEQAQLLAFKVVDVRITAEHRNYVFACVIDDRTPTQKRAVKRATLTTLSQYLDSVILWSQHDSFQQLVSSIS